MALQEIPVLLSWFVFLARKRLEKIREGKAVSSSCQLANTLEATLKTIVCAICVVPVLKECLGTLRLWTTVSCDGWECVTQQKYQ